MAEDCIRNLRNVAAVSVLVLSSLIASGQTSPTIQSNMELRLIAAQNNHGVPDSIGFVFANIGDHEVAVPPVSPCIGRYSGTLNLTLEFSPSRPSPRKGNGKGGGCAGGLDHIPGILEQAKTWRKLRPGESFTVSYKREELFVSEQAPGAYEFWGGYRPPRLTEEEITALEQAGIDFPREPLSSTHLHFNRPE
jgi:hypothetical protein